MGDDTSASVFDMIAKAEDGACHLHKISEADTKEPAAVHTWIKEKLSEA